MGRFPCKDCEDRYLARHDRCEKYQEASRKNEAYKAKRDAQNILRQYKQDGLSKVLGKMATNRR